MAHNKNFDDFEVWSVDFPETLNIYFYITQACTKKELATYFYLRDCRKISLLLKSSEFKKWKLFDSLKFA